MKSQRGSITVYVTISCLFVLIIGIASYILLTNKQMAQAEMTNEIIQKYNDTTNLQEVYNQRDGGEIIPIDNLANFKKIGTDEQVYINGKVYTFSTDATYVLQTDLVYDGDYSQMIARIKDNNIVVTGDYEIAVTTNNVTDYYVSRWNYTVPRGKVYGSLYKINDDEYHLIFNASGNLAKGYTTSQLVGTSDDISGGSSCISTSYNVYISNELWGQYSDKIIKCKIEEEIKPTSTVCYFLGLSQITEIEGIQNIDTSKVTSMFDMFFRCRNLTSIDVTNFDTSNVTNMRSMFSGCNNLKSLDVSHFDTNKVKDMYSMFYDCQNLTDLNLSSFDTREVTTMYAMFDNCPNLANLDLSSFNTSLVTNMDFMFYKCEKLTSIDISNFDTSIVTNTNHMFACCSDLKTIYVGNSWTTSAVTDSTDMFSYSYKLVGATKYTSSNANDATYANWATGYLTYKSPLLDQLNYAKDGLVLWYDGIQNTRSGHNNNATTWEVLCGNKDGVLNNFDSTASSGWSSNCLIFDGSNDWVGIGEMNYDNVTLEVVMEWKYEDSTEREIVCSYETGGYAIGTFTGSYSNIDKNAFTVYISGKGYNAVTALNSYVRDKKYRLSGSYDGNTIKLWENSNKYTRNLAGTIKFPDVSTIMVLGANPNGTTGCAPYSAIKIYSVRVYNRALTDEEVQQNYEADKVRFGITD